MPIRFYLNHLKVFWLLSLDIQRNFRTNMHGASSRTIRLFARTGYTGKQKEGFGLDGGNVGAVIRIFVLASMIYAINRFYGITIKRQVV